ncbi:hypothetical protein Bbelb_192500 [Branchiostoma belcheri]|nr:hypothetical protein Bbelb_192500 [Branchiostoma belcheri]
MPKPLVTPPDLLKFGLPPFRLPRLIPLPRIYSTLHWQGAVPVCAVRPSLGPRYDTILASHGRSQGGFGPLALEPRAWPVYWPWKKSGTQATFDQLSVSVCTYDGKFVGMLWVLALARVKGSPLKAPHLGEYITVVRKVPAMWGTGPSEPQGSYKRPCPGAAVMVRRPEALSGPGALGAGAGPPEASSGRKGRLSFEGRGTRAPNARYIRSHWGRECGPVARATSTSLYQDSGSGWKKSRN